jgi:hypothetical protein
LSYLNLIHQFSQQRAALYQQHVRQLERLIEASFQRLGSFAELSPGLAGLGPALATGDNARIRLFLGSTGQTFSSVWG